jgi:hypothetical protein
VIRLATVSLVYITPTLLKRALSARFALLVRISIWILQNVLQNSSEGDSQISKGMTEGCDIELWIDSLPLSRKRKNLARDFSDGLFMAEVLHIFYPKIVDLHNYEQALRIDTKIYNWNTLNQKVFKKIGATIDPATITAIANSQPGAIDRFLCQIRDIVTNRQSMPTQTPKGKPAVRREKQPLVVRQMGDDDRELLVAQIRESHRQTELIRALEAKEAKLTELMRVKDAKIVKLMAKREAAK